MKRNKRLKNNMKIKRRERKSEGERAGKYYDILLLLTFNELIHKETLELGKNKRNG